ncbi:MAG: hypothetical protein HRT87_07210 [Legionellales bacterium]|nr:hypothetical protein [Legionellales bacterium]
MKYIAKINIKLILCLYIVTCFSYDYPTSKKGLVFHGSRIRGLKTLIPKQSTHKKQFVYATIEPIVAALFIASHSDFDLYISGSGKISDPLVVVERYRNAFKLLRDIKGSLYAMSDKNFEHKTNWEAELVSFKPEDIIFEYKIDNLWDFLTLSQKDGKTKLYYYPNHPKDVPVDDQDIIEKSILWDQTELLIRMHPHLKERVQRYIQSKISEN